MKLIQGVETSNEVVALIKSQESVDFKIGDMGKIIDILRSKIYSNPIQTLVQEYLCNARDAIREVDGERIVVTLPSPRDAVLKIRDFGPGISKDRMLNTFTQYGNTTKANSNSQTGGFGLGSKLAWAYTDTFTIITWVDGTEYNYLAHIGKNRNGTLELISTQPSKELNGTEIRVPVKPQDFQAFIAAVERATYFWDFKPEITNAEIRSGLDFETISLGKGIHLYPSGSVPESISCQSGAVLCIDGVAYPISESFTHEKFDGKPKRGEDGYNTYSYSRLNSNLETLASLVKEVVVFHVGNGQVEISASRETISENERTFKVVNPKAGAAIDALKAWVETACKDSENLQDFISNAKMLMNYTNLNSFDYKDGSETFTLHQTSTYNNNRLELSSKEIAKLELNNLGSDDNNSRYNRRRNKPDGKINLDKKLIVVDVPTSKAKQTQKARLLTYSAMTLGKGTNSLEYLKKLGVKLGATLISSIELPKVERAQSERVAAGLLKVQQFKKSGYDSRKSTKDVVIDLSDNKASWVYIPKDSMEKVTQYASLRAVLDHCNVNLCVMGSTGIKTVAGNAQFTSLDAFLKQPTSVLTKAQYAKLLTTSGSYIVDGVSDKLSGLDLKLTAKLKDKKLKTDLETLLKYTDSTYSYGFDMQDFLIQHLIKTDKTMQHLNNLKTALPKYVQDNYPLVAYIDSYSSNDYYYNESGQRVEKKVTVKLGDYNLEIVHYLNGKYSA